MKAKFFGWKHLKKHRKEKKNRSLNLCRKFNVHQLSLSATSSSTGPRSLVFTGKQTHCTNYNHSRSSLFLSRTYRYDIIDYLSHISESNFRLISCSGCSSCFGESLLITFTIMSITYQYCSCLLMYFLQFWILLYLV